MTMDDELRALIKRWRNNSASQRRVSDNEDRPVSVRAAHWGAAETFGQCADQLEELLHARSTPCDHLSASADQLADQIGHCARCGTTITRSLVEAPPVYERRCAACAGRFLLPEPKPDPWYCPRCWQARGSKESER